MEKSGEVIARFCSALMRMPNIKKVIISLSWCCYLDNYQHSRYFLDPEPEHNEAFLLMACFISLTGSRIVELDIESNDAFDQDRGVTGAVFQGMSDMNLRHCCDAFRGLRKVQMTIAQDDVDGWMTGYLAKIFSCATDLEDVCVDGGYEDPMSPRYLFSNTIWSHLTF